MASKYIDVEELITCIKQKIENIESCPFQLASFGEEKKSEGELIAYKDTLSLIDSLQQEQSEVHYWKPSEEQMGSLNYAYCELFKREDVGHNILGPLQNLIDILSKL